jgi:hypothetical protein
VDEIVTDVNCSLDQEAAAAFPQVKWEDLKGVACRVNILLGFANLRYFPMEEDQKDSLVLWSSQFGTRWMIARRTQPGCTCEGCESTALVDGVSSEHFQPLDFIRAEALGTDMLARCVACQNSKEYKFRADSISFKENKEYKVIINGLQLEWRIINRWPRTNSVFLPGP